MTNVHAPRQVGEAEACAEEDAEARARINALNGLEQTCYSTRNNLDTNDLTDKVRSHVVLRSCPFYTRSTEIFGGSISETAMLPNPS